MITRTLNALIVVALVNAIQNVYAVDTSPIAVSNSLPIAFGNGLPKPKSADILEQGQTKLTITGFVQSNASDSGSDQELLIIDGESHSIDFDFRFGITPRLELNAQIQLIRHTAGNLDGLIEKWHGVFSLPDGDRDLFAQDQLQFSYSNAEQSNSITESQSGLSNLQIGVAYQLLQNNKLNIAVGSGVSLPTGNASSLLGSDKSSFHISVLTSSAGLRKLGWHANFGVLRIGDDELFGIKTKANTWFTSLGTHWQIKERLRLSAQVDGHGAVFESNIDEISKSAWQLALAAEYSLKGSDKYIQIFFSEDLSVNRATDFSFGISWSTQF